MRYLSFFVTIALSIVATSELFAQAPDTISVQGMLTDFGGQPVNDTLDFTTTFYKGGVAGYTQLHSNVLVKAGVFNLAIVHDGSRRRPERRNGLVCYDRGRSSESRRVDICDDRWGRTERYT